MKRIYLYIITGLLVLGTAGYFWLAGSNTKDVKYRTEKVSRGDVVVQVRATGTINPVQTVQVGSQVSGTISKIYVDFNSEVKKGQVIAVIDSTLLNASVKEAEANLERNQAQVNEAERSLKRTTGLFKKDLVSQADLDVARTAYESALAQFKQTEAALDRVRVNLRYAVIRAPIDGVVISRDVDVGQTVAASLQTPKLFGIANDLKRMQVEASVDEADIGQIKTGEHVSFTVDAYPDETFSGEVTQVRLAPVNVQNVVTYTVVIAVPNPDLKLRPGMTATVSILIDKRENVLRVPTLAMRFQPPPDVLTKMDEQKSGDATAAESKGSQTGEQTTKPQRPDGRQWQRGQGGGGGGERHWKREGQQEDRKKMGRVWILEDGKRLKSIVVTTGINDSRFVEILAGDLKENDEIILSTSGTEAATGPMQQSNPFQTRMPGGGGGRGGRF